MRVEVLVSTMNQNENNQLQKEMNLKNNYVIINQITKNSIDIPKDVIEDTRKFISYKERGLSKSRNKAIKNSNADICVLADDDMFYTEDYEEIIEEGYKKYVDADIIAFFVDNEDKSKNKKILKEGRVNFLKSMKISSVQITFKKESIINKKIKFNEKFGTGAQYFFGEENIFLSKCLQAGLKIYYIPRKIATLKISNSSWFKGHTKENYNVAGAVYYEMSNFLYPILIIQFVIRKKKLYKEYLKPKQVMQYMFEGVKKYKKELKNNEQ